MEYSGAPICHSSANSQNRMKPSGINHVMLLTIFQPGDKNDSDWKWLFWQK